MKHMKKILSLALVAVSLFAVALPALAENASEDEMILLQQADWERIFGRPNLVRKDEHNLNVYRLQVYLNTWGRGSISLSTDGRFGSDTETVVIEFQRAVGLSADGIVGQQTKQKLIDVVGILF